MRDQDVICATYLCIDFFCIRCNYRLRIGRLPCGGRGWGMPKLRDVRIDEHEGFAIGNLPAGVAQICKLNFGPLTSVCDLGGAWRLGKRNHRAAGAIKSASQLCRLLMHVAPVIFPTSVGS